MKILPLILAAWARLAAPQDGVMPPLVVVSSLEPDIARPLVDRFRAAHPGVEVQLVELDSRVALERIRGEAAAKRIATSVWWGADDLALQEAAGEGLLDPYTPAWAGSLRATQRHSDSLWTGLYMVPIALVSKPTCQDLPAAYEDLADPRFRTRLLLRLPSSSEAMRRFLGVMFTSRFVDKIGIDSAFDWAAMVYVNREDDEFLDDDKILTRLADKAAPECELALLPASTAVIARDFDGLGIRISFLPAAPAYLEGIARVKGAPNSEAAAQFIEFAGTADAGRQALKRGHVPIAGDPGAAPPMGLTLELDADLGRRDLMLRELPAWLTRIEQRVRAGVAVQPEGEDPNLWIFNIIDIVGTLIIVAVLVVLFRRGKFKQLVETAASGAPPNSPPSVPPERAEGPGESRP